MLLLRNLLVRRRGLGALYAGCGSTFTKTQGFESRVHRTHMEREGRRREGEGKKEKKKKTEKREKKEKDEREGHKEPGEINLSLAR